jgi:hypothetical protein
MAVALATDGPAQRIAERCAASPCDFLLAAHA